MNRPYDSALDRLLVDVGDSESGVEMGQQLPQASNLGTSSGSSHYEDFPYQPKVQADIGNDKSEISTQMTRTMSDFDTASYFVDGNPLIDTRSNSIDIETGTYCGRGFRSSSRSTEAESVCLYCGNDVVLEGAGCMCTNKFMEGKIRMSSMPYLDETSTLVKMSEYKRESSILRKGPLERIHGILYFFISATIVFIGGCIVSNTFKVHLISVLWCQNGLCVLWLLIWYKDWDSVVAILSAYITGYIFSYVVLCCSIPIQIFMGHLGGSLAQIVISAAGLQRWCRNEVRMLDTKSILTFRMFFSFIIIAGIIAPLCGGITFMVISYKLLSERYHQHLPVYIISVWSLISSTGMVSVLWVGLVVVATTRRRIRNVYIRHFKRKKVPCLRNGTMYLKNKNFRVLLWKVPMVLALAFVSFVSISFIDAELLLFGDHTALLLTPMTALVSWVCPPIVSALFILYITTSISALLLEVGKISEAKKFSEICSRVFIDQLIIVLTSIFVIISVYRNKIIIDELSKEHRKLCRAVKDAEKIQNEAELFAVISHEIKTPLNVIQGFSKEIEEYRPAVPSEANSFAKHISEASSHILDIISELLLLFQLKKSRGEFWSIRHRPIDLHAFWRTTCEKIVSLGDQYGVHVGYAVDEGVPASIKSDQRRLTQVLLNLASNAVQFTASGARPVLEDKQNAEQELVDFDSKLERNVDLELQYLPHSKSIKIRICDTGEGISTQLQEYMSRMFNDTSEEMNGDVCETLSESFVGLSIASEIVKKMGGKIAVDSDLGHGTEFNVTIPVTCCNSSTRKPPVDFIPPIISTEINIMIVEDSAVNRRLLHRMLARLGYSSICHASNGLEALQLVKNAINRFDIILLDLSMPQMDGIEFLTSLMVNGRPPSLTNASIIITSGHVSDDLWSELQRLGTNGRVDKPYKQENVGAAIEKAVRKRRGIGKTTQCCYSKCKLNVFQ